MGLMENNESPAWAPVCDVCKTRDKTLRAVSYPFVFSIVVVTFQRAFTGIYCKKHQRIYHLLASLITSIAGWLGIPYGFILTPITLFKLARGGVSNIEVNIRLLTAIADKKLGENDTTGAIQCLEEILKLRESPEVSERLKKLYLLNRSLIGGNESGILWTLISIPGLLAASSIIGLLIGLIDLLIVYLLYPFFSTSNSIIIIIISWLPTVTLIFLGVLSLRAILAWALNKAGLVSVFAGYFITFASTLSMYYSILQGQAIIRNLQALITFFSASIVDGVFALRSTLTHGGIDLVVNNFSYGGIPNIIFTVLILGGVFLSLLTGMEMAAQSGRWHNLLTQIKSSISLQQENPTVVAWGITFATIIGGVLILALTYPGQYVNIEDIHQKMLLGMSELQQYHPDKAMEHFQDASSLWPNSATGHIYLSLGHSDLDQYDRALEEINESLDTDPNSNVAHLLRAYILTSQFKFNEAINEFQIVSANQPDWGVPYASLAILHYNLGNDEVAKGDIEAAISRQNGDAQTISTIGGYYLYLLDFKQAEEYFLKAIQLSNSPSDHLILARAYMAQGRLDDAEKTIKGVEETADPIDVYLSKIALAEYRSDLVTAKSLVMEAIQLYPESSMLYGEKSFIELKLGHESTAIVDAEKAIQLNPYNAHVYVELAYALHAQGRLAEAQAMAEKAVAFNPKYDRVHYILGLCYLDKGFKDKAIAEFEEFLELYWERPLVKEDKENAEAYLDQLK